jgi:hypothetical protein
MGDAPVYRDDRTTPPLQAAADLYAWWILKWEREGLEDWVGHLPFPWGIKRDIRRLAMSFSVRDFLIEHSRGLIKYARNQEELEYGNHCDGRAACVVARLATAAPVEWLSNDDGQLAALLFAASSPSFSAMGSNQNSNKIPAISAPMRWHGVQQRVRKNSPGSGRPDAEDSVRRYDIG